MTHLHTVAATTKTGSKFSLRRTNAEICKLAFADIKVALIEAGLVGNYVCVSARDGHVIELEAARVAEGTDPVVVLAVAMSALLEYHRESNVAAFTNFHVKARYTGRLEARAA